MCKVLPGFNPKHQEKKKDAFLSFHSIPIGNLMVTCLMFQIASESFHSPPETIAT